MALSSGLVQCAQTARAHFDRLVHAIHFEGGAMYVRKPAAPGMALRVTHLVSVRGAFATNVTLHVVRSCFTFALTIATIAWYHECLVRGKTTL